MTTRKPAKRGILAAESWETVTPQQWRRSTPAQRLEFHRRARKQGITGAVCLVCGYPIHYSPNPCPACPS